MKISSLNTPVMINRLVRNPSRLCTLKRAVTLATDCLWQPNQLQIAEDGTARQWNWIDETGTCVLSIGLENGACRVDVDLHIDDPDLLIIVGWCAINGVTCVVNDKNGYCYHVEANAEVYDIAMRA